MKNDDPIEQILSPLSRSHNISQVRTIRTKEIINAYKKFDINVSSYFQGRETISLYQCNDTGYYFYYPFQLMGDSKFYEQLQKFDWYYMPWKWEHEIAKTYIRPDSRLLEVGCGQGAFIKNINRLIHLSYSIGLELNESAEETAQNYEIRNEPINAFSKTHTEFFDVVCSFQVLEHISDVYDFVSCQLACLKTGGVLLVSVPNNDSFLKDLNTCLDMPPHHMGLWNEKSLRALESIFRLKVLHVYREELQDYHIGDFLTSKYYGHYSPTVRRVMIRAHKLIGIYQKRYRTTLKNRKNILGQTLFMAYEKL